MDLIIIGDVLKKKRNELGRTQNEVAKAAGVTGSYISMLEKGEMPNPTINALASIAEQLEMSFDELIAYAAEIEAKAGSKKKRLLSLMARKSCKSKRQSTPRI